MEQPRARAFGAAGAAVVLLLVLIFVGSRGLRDFNSALIGYAVATVFAIAALIYRYTLWLGRPPTWRNSRRSTLLIPRAW